MKMIPHGHAATVSDASRCILAPKRPPPPQSICPDCPVLYRATCQNGYLDPSVLLELALEEGGECRQG